MTAEKSDMFQKKKNFKTNKSVGRVTPDVPEFNEEW